jgi:TP901 family phage tail tape measure protein
MASNDKLVRIILKLVDEFSGELDKASSKLNSVGKNMMKVGAGLTAGLTLPIAAVGIAATKTAIEFEAAFAGVEKTVSGSGDELAQIQRELNSLATSGSSPVAALENAQLELYEIAEAAGQLGVKRQDIVEFSDVMGQLAMSTNIAGEEGAQMVAQFANVSRMPLSDIRKFGDVISTLGNSLATTENDILRFGQRMGTLSNIGFNPEEILAYGGAMASAGVTAELGSTNFLKGAQNIAVAVAQGGDQLSLLADMTGQSAEQFAKAWEQDAAGAMQSFVEALGDMPLEEQVAVLDQLNLNGSEAQRTFLTLAGNTELLGDALNMAGEAMQGNNALFEESQKRAETTAGQLNILRNNLTQLAADLGAVILPVLNMFLGALIPLVQAFNNLPGPVKTVTVAILALLAAIGPVMMIVGGIISAVGTIGTVVAGLSGIFAGVSAAIAGIGAALPAIGAGIAALAAPIAIAIAAIIALIAVGALLINNWDKVKEVISRIGEGIGVAIDRIKGLGEQIGTIARLVGESLFNAFKGLAGAFLSLGAQIIGGLVEGIKSKVAALVQTVKDMASRVTNSIRDAFQIRSPSKLMAKMGNQVVAGFNQGIDAMGGLGVNTPQLGQMANAVAPSLAGAGMGMGGGVTINIENLTVPSGTTREQVDFLLQEMGKRVKQRGAKGF